MVAHVDWVEGANLEGGAVVSIVLVFGEGWLLAGTSAGVVGVHGFYINSNRGGYEFRFADILT